MGTRGRSRGYLVQDPGPAARAPQVIVGAHVLTGPQLLARLLGLGRGRGPGVLQVANGVRGGASGPDFTFLTGGQIDLSTTFVKPFLRPS